MFFCHFVSMSKTFCEAQHNHEGEHNTGGNTADTNLTDKKGEAILNIIHIKHDTITIKQEVTNTEARTKTRGIDTMTADEETC